MRARQRDTVSGLVKANDASQTDLPLSNLLVGRSELFIHISNMLVGRSELFIPFSNLTVERSNYFVLVHYSVKKGINYV